MANRLKFRLRPIVLGAAIACVSLSAHADIFSLIAVAASWAGSAAAAGTVFAITAGQAFAIAIGASLLGVANQRRQQRRAAAAQKAQYNASLTDRNVTVMNSESPWQIVYGSPAPVGGYIADILTTGDRDQFKHLVIWFAAHECESIDEIYIDGEAVGDLDVDGWCEGGKFFENATDEYDSVTAVLDGSGHYTLTGIEVLEVTSAYLGGTSTPTTVTFTYGSGNSVLTGPAGATVLVHYRYLTGGTPRVNIQKHLSPGGVDTADAFLMAADPVNWTSDHKLSGFTYIVLTLGLDMARFQGGPPNVTAKLKGKLLYDFRDSSTAYSANPALARADFIMSECGFGADDSQIDEDAVIAAANACDDAAYTPSDNTAGTDVLYSCDGVFTSDQDRESTLQQLEDCCAGSTHESGGVWRILVGTWTSAVMALGNADAHGAVKVQQTTYGIKDRFNGARGKYVDWRNLGVSGDFTPYQNSTFATADGVDRFKDLTLPFTSAHQRAQQLARVEVEKSRGGLVIHYPAHMRAWPLQPGDRVTVTHSELGFSAKSFRVSDWAFGLTSPVLLELIEDEDTFYDLADEVTIDPAPNSILSDPFDKPAAPDDLDIESGDDHILVQGDGTITTRVLVSWAASEDARVTNGGKVQIQWLDAADANSNWQTQEESGDATSAYIYGTKPGQTILVRVRFTAPLSGAGEFSNDVHDVTGKETASAETIEDFAATGILWGVRLDWTNPTNRDVGSVEVYVSDSPSGGTLRTNPAIGGAWGKAASWVETPISPGTTKYFRLRPVDRSGNPGDYTAWVSGVSQFVALTDLGTDVTAVTAALKAAQDRSDRQLVNGLHNLGTTAIEALLDIERHNQELRDAGVITDPVTGTIRLYALDYATERWSDVNVLIDGVNSRIDLRATTTYVDAQIAAAILDPTALLVFDALDIRVSAAEVAIDGLEASVLLTATQVEVDDHEARITTAEADIDAAEAEIALRVETTTFNTLAADVTSAENRITLLEDGAEAVTAVQAASYKQVKDQHKLAETTIGDLVNGQATKDLTIAGLASARSELHTKVNDGLSAQATASTELLARLDSGDYAAVKFQSAASATTLGNISATYTLELDVDGVVLSLKGVNDGITRAFTIDGDLIVNGTLTTDKLVVGAATSVGGENDAVGSAGVFPGGTTNVTTSQADILMGFDITGAPLNIVGDIHTYVLITASAAALSYAHVETYLYEDGGVIRYRDQYVPAMPDPAGQQFDCWLPIKMFADDGVVNVAGTHDFTFNVKVTCYGASGTGVVVTSGVVQSVANLAITENKV